MINPLGREIRPEDFITPPGEVHWHDSDDPGAYARKLAEKAELKRLYEIQEAAKARAAFKAEQERKDQIPFSEILASEICRRVSAGEFLINICKDDDMPTARTAIQWKKDHSDFAELYRNAINDRLDIFEDELCTISDSSENDYKVITKGNKTTKVLDGEVISRAKLRVDVRKAHLKAYRPERRSEQSTINVNNNDAFDPANMTTEELEKKLADLEEKAYVVKETKVA